MKRKIYNIINKLSRAATVSLSAMALSLTACEDKPFEPSIDLGVNNETVKLANKESETPVSIYSTGDWNVRLEPQVDWASVNRASGSGNGQVLLSYKSNPQSIRRVTMVITRGGVQRRILFEQEGDAVTFRFKLDGREMTFEKMQAKRYLTFATNLPNDQFANVEVRDMHYVEGEEGWMSDIRIEGRVLAFDVTENETGAPRSASLTVVYVDPYDNDAEYETTATVTQSVTSSTAITIDELISRFEAAAAAGLVDNNGNWKVSADEESGIKVVGYAVSDSDGENTATNSENKWVNTGYPSMSNEVNGRTAYIQNADANMGIRLSMSSAAENIITRFGETHVRVDGLTMQRLQNPTRYSINNIPIYNIVSVSEADETKIPVKEKYISELTDADVYTYVKLRDAEFTYKQSSFYCTNNGYASMCDIYPVNVRDINGDRIYMYVNHGCSWARNGQAIPQGSGTLGGVITYEASNRFGIDGDMGRYCIRPFDAADLQVDVAADPRYVTVAEWNWDNKALNKTSDNRVLPITGSGYLYHDKETVVPALANNFNELIADATAKGTKYSAACRFTTEWITSDKQLLGVNAEFSTANAVGRNMTVTFAGYAGDQSANGTGIVVPSYWVIQYSVDGENFTTLPASRFVLHPFVCWNAKCPDFATYGLHEYSFNLPDELFGREKVVLKFVPEDNRATTSINAPEQSPAGSTLSASTKSSVTFSDITIKYNK